VVTEVWDIEAVRPGSVEDGAAAGTRYRNTINGDLDLFHLRLLFNKFLLQIAGGDVFLQLLFKGRIGFYTEFNF
jgi:hypothetical protein